jgi:hypothetical protein
LRSFEERKNIQEKIRNEGLKFIDEGKKKTELKEFDVAYQYFEKAIANFKEIGWNKQIRYINTEIKNTKGLEENYRKEQAEREKLREELERKKQAELEQMNKEEFRMKEMISEVGTLADDVSNMIKAKGLKAKFADDERRKEIEREAKDFSRSMGEMMKIKQELIAEIKKSEEDKKKELEQKQKEKERKEVDEIARMLKDLKNNKK